jgi:hypothetical protein
MVAKRKQEKAHPGIVKLAALLLRVKRMNEQGNNL